MTNAHYLSKLSNDMLLKAIEWRSSKNLLTIAVTENNSTNVDISHKNDGKKASVSLQLANGLSTCERKLLMYLI